MTELKEKPQSLQASASPPCSAAVLDPCCGSRMMWFDRQNPNVIFGDKRSETLTVTDRSHGRTDGTRTLRIEPDVMLDFRALPYPDGAFKLVAFDPPHIERAGPCSWLAAKYGKLSDNWREDLRQGFAECFRVLEPDGVLVFKWNETHVKLREVLALTPERPLFGQVSGRRGLTRSGTTTGRTLRRQSGSTRPRSWRPGWLSWPPGARGITPAMSGPLQRVRSIKELGN